MLKERDLETYLSLIFLYVFSQGNKSTCVPAEMIAPLINSEEKIVHLVVCGNAMKQE
jgi:hypothetical protein